MPDFLNLPNLHTLNAQDQGDRYQVEARTDTRTTVPKKLKKAVQQPRMMKFTTSASMSRVPSQSLFYETVLEESFAEYGPYIPTLVRKLEAGDFALVSTPRAFIGMKGCMKIPQ